MPKLAREDMLRILRKHADWCKGFRSYHGIPRETVGDAIYQILDEHDLLVGHRSASLSRGIGKHRVKQLLAVMKREGWSARETAKYLRVTEGAVSRWIHGKRAIPGPVEVALEARLQVSRETK
jgi:DNA-directed RNA polymerase specialized sigma24 family protein